MNDNNINTEKGRIQSLEGFGLLAGGLAHDYNNMLTAMLGNIDLILCDDIPDSVRETAEDIKSVMLRAATLVKRMLSYASHSEPHNEEVDLNGVVKDIVRIMKRAIPDNAVVNILPQQRVPLVFADVASLWQVIMNLIVNACDALEGSVGLVKVGITHKKLNNDGLKQFVSDGQILPGDYVEIMVEDSGCGMDDATAARIFEPLFTTKTKGNGLGLPSVLSIVTTNKGGIKVESIKGKGTVFKVVIPAHRKENGDLLYADGKGEAGIQKANLQNVQGAKSENTDAIPTAESPETTSLSADKTPARVTRCPEGTEIKTILVVDDDVSIVKLLKIILEKSKCYKVVSAYNGEQGLSVFKQNKDEISLCLVDASMGAGMNGIDLCSAIRTESQVPFILMSAYRAKEMSTRMVTAGVSAFLAKPFRGSDVLDACSKFLFSQDA